MLRHNVSSNLRLFSQTTHNENSNDNGIYGYRVAPGTDARAFETLGFKSGDIVTAVNGLDLGDPANTISLYQTMRDATEAD